jgi:hypothetical protein
MLEPDKRVGLHYMCFSEIADCKGNTYAAGWLKKTVISVVP